MNIVQAMRVAAESSQSNELANPKILTPVRARSRLWLPLVAVVTTILCLPFFRLVVGVGDEGVLLHGAERMLEGSKLYTDFFEFLPPGGFVLTAAWFSVTGISFLSARVLTVLIVVLIACLTHLVCRQVSRNDPLSAFLAISWACTSQGVWQQLNHHWLTTLLSVVGAWAAFTSLEPGQRSLRWPLIAGAATGAAAMITPTRGALAVLAALIGFRNWRQDRAAAITYLFAVFLAPAGLVAYLAANHSFAVAFDDVIRFTASRYAGIQSVPFGYGASLAFLPLLAMFPAAGLLTVLVSSRDWRGSLRDRRLHLCAAFGLAGFIGCYPRPDIVHIAFAAPLVCPLLAYCIARLIQSSHRLSRYFAAFAIWIGIISAGQSVMMANLLLGVNVAKTQRGDIKLLKPEGAGKMLSRIAAIPPDDGFFFYPYMPLMPFLADREHVSKYDIFVPGYTLPSQYRDACLSAMRQAEWLVTGRESVEPELWMKAFPAMEDARPRETVEFEQALDRGFEFVARDGSIELRRRRKDTGEDICNNLLD
jgi:hypothetical protein